MARPEDALTIQVASLLRDYTQYGKLAAVWTHVAHEGKRGPIAGARAKRMGLIAGVPDFIFTWRNGSGWIELKAPAYLRLDKHGKQVRVPAGQPDPNQRAFAAWCGRHDVKWALARSTEEVVRTLGDWGILLP